MKLISSCLLLLTTHFSQIVPLGISHKKATNRFQCCNNDSHNEPFWHHLTDWKPALITIDWSFQVTKYPTHAFSRCVYVHVNAKKRLFNMMTPTMRLWLSVSTIQVHLYLSIDNFRINKLLYMPYHEAFMCIIMPIMPPCHNDSHS